MSGHVCTINVGFDPKQAERISRASHLFKLWSIRNKAHRQRYNRRYRLKNLKRIQRKEREYRKRTKAHRAKVHRQWVAKHKEHRRRYLLDYCRKHRAHRRRTFKAWRLKNKEKRKAYMRSRYQHNPKVREQAALACRKWNSENKNKVIQKRRDYALKNRLKIKRYMRLYSQRRYWSMRGRLIAQTSAYAKAHPEIRKKAARNWKLNHPEEYRARNAAENARRRGADVGDRSVRPLIKQWRSEPDFKCTYCKRRFPSSKMHIDHIFPISKGGKHTMENICRSCGPCNVRKGNKILA